MSERDDGRAGPVRHVRANYTLERGSWRATCRDCAWHTSDPNRRRAAAMFRLHHAHVTEVIDLMDEAFEEPRLNTPSQL
jgi:hypothetical protein